MEHISHAKSVAIGLLVGAGSVDDPEEYQGISHLIEHMVFKGTIKRTAKDIAKEIDMIGGKIFAHTAKEYTSYYSVVLSDHYDVALEILSDLYQNALFDKKDLEKEKGVVYEEIAMYEDTPDENIHDSFIKNILQGHVLGREILGKKESLKKITRDDLVNFVKDHYVPNNTILTIVGDFKKKEIMDQVKYHFAPLIRKEIEYSQQQPEYFGGINIEKKDTEQVHLCLGSRGVSFEDDRRYSLSLMSVILGGSMSSRLFQNIREDKGLVYSVFSFPSFFSNSGVFCIYAGTNTKNAQKVINMVMDELKLIKDQPVSEEELYHAKEHLKGNIVLNLESTENRMSWLSRAYYYYKEIKDVEFIFEKIDQVHREDIQKIAYELFNNNDLQLTAIGKLKNFKLKEI